MDDVVRGIGVAHDHRAQEHQQIGLGAAARIVAEQVADERDAAQHRDLVLAAFDPLLDQAAEHDDLAVVDEHVGLDRAPVGDDV
ncbi:MAG: hypothetical protein R3E68_12645 [Burkholderiaceae bacterium]